MPRSPCGYTAKTFSKRLMKTESPGREPSPAEVEPGDGFAKNDSLTVARYGFKVVNVWKNDEVSKERRVNHRGDQRPAYQAR